MVLVLLRNRCQKVIVNESMARSFWPDQHPLGKRITMPWGADMHAEVVGYYVMSPSKSWNQCLVQPSIGICRNFLIAG